MFFSVQDTVTFWLYYFNRLFIGLVPSSTIHFPHWIIILIILKSIFHHVAPRDDNTAAVLPWLQNKFQALLQIPQGRPSTVCSSPMTSPHTLGSSKTSSVSCPSPDPLCSPSLHYSSLLIPLLSPALPNSCFKVGLTVETISPFSPKAPQSGFHAALRAPVTPHQISALAGITHLSIDLCTSLWAVSTRQAS